LKDKFVSQLKSLCSRGQATFWAEAYFPKIKYLGTSFYFRKVLFSKQEPRPILKQKLYPNLSSYKTTGVYYCDPTIL
jgi:hypothetical protein